MRLIPAALCVALLWLAGVAGAQPAVDIHLLQFSRAEDGALRFESIENITQRQGYDNQPAFLPDGSAILFTSMRDTLQSDIYRYDLESGEIHRVTATPESEYSPTPIAGGSRFSTVRVEMDESQRLWEFDMAGENAALVLPAVQPVGYHAWGPEDRLALFVLGEPHELHLAKRGPEPSVASCADIGRSLQTMPDGQRISFLQRRIEGEDESWWIRAVNSVDASLEDIAKAPAGAQDHAWSPWGSIFMTQGSKLFELDLNGGQGWQERADFAEKGLAGLTRLAFRPGGGYLALVAAEAEESSNDAEK